MGQTRPTHFELWTVESELIHSPLFTCSVNSWGGRKGRKRGGPAVLLAVADRRMAWTAVGPSSSSVCFFFCSVLSLIPCFIPSPSLWSFFYFYGSNCYCSRCWWWQWWLNVAADGGSRRQLLLLSLLFLLFLCLSLFLLLLLFLTV